MGSSESTSCTSPRTATTHKAPSNQPTFTTSGRKCFTHDEPADHICLNESCSINVLACSQCIVGEHQHREKLLVSCEDFLRGVQAGISQKGAKLNFKENKGGLQKSGDDSLDVRETVRNAKARYQKQQLLAFELIMKLVTEEKKSLFDQLDRLEKVAVGERNRAAAASEKLRSYYYLQSFNTAELIDLKWRTSSQLGMTTFRNKFNNLKSLKDKDILVLKEAKQAKDNISLKIRSRIAECYSDKLKQLIKMSTLPRVKPEQPAAVFARKQSFEPTRHKSTGLFERKNSSELTQTPRTGRRF